MKTIGIITALDKESVFLKKNLGVLEKEEIIADQLFQTYNLKNKKIVIVDCRIGEINAAIATTLLVTKFNVEAILNFGAVGGLNPDLKLSDMVLVTDVVHYDFDLSPTDNVVCGQYPWFNSISIHSSEELLQLAYKLTDFTLKPGIVASGDKFVSNFNQKNHLITQYNADICDMEAAGIALTATYFKIPYLMIKIVSDHADDTAQFDFNLFIQSGIEKYCHLAKKILEVL